MRSVPFGQRWAVATAGLGPRRLGPPCPGREAASGWESRCHLWRPTRSPGTVYFLASVPGRVRSRGSGNKGVGGGGGLRGLGRVVGCSPSAFPGMRGACSALLGSAIAEPLAEGDYVAGRVCVRACGGGARPILPGAVVGGVAEVGRASRGRARRRQDSGLGPRTAGLVAGSRRF